jgi:hypothetical protein
MKKSSEIDINKTGPTYDEQYNDLNKGRGKKTDENYPKKNKEELEKWKRS